MKMRIEGTITYPFCSIGNAGTSGARGPIGDVGYPGA